MGLQRANRVGRTVTGKIEGHDAFHGNERAGISRESLPVSVFRFRPTLLLGAQLAKLYVAEGILWCNPDQLVKIAFRFRRVALIESCGGVKEVALRRTGRDCAELVRDQLQRA